MIWRSLVTGEYFYDDYGRELNKNMLLNGKVVTVYLCYSRFNDDFIEVVG